MRPGLLFLHKKKGDPFQMQVEHHKCFSWRWCLAQRERIILFFLGICLQKVYKPALYKIPRGNTMFSLIFIKQSFDDHDIEDEQCKRTSGSFGERGRIWRKCRGSGLVIGRDR